MNLLCKLLRLDNETKMETDRLVSDIFLAGTFKFYLDTKKNAPLGSVRAMDILASNLLRSG